MCIYYVYIAEEQTEQSIIKSGHVSGFLNKLYPHLGIRVHVLIIVCEVY